MVVEEMLKSVVTKAKEKRSWYQNVFRQKKDGNHEQSVKDKRLFFLSEEEEMGNTVQSFANDN